jgi:hypothetical protein
VTPSSKLRDFYNLMHLPYTGMVLSFVLIGAVVAPEVSFDRLLATMVAYFLGLGIAAHAFDQLEPRGSHYIQKLTKSELVGLGVIGLAGAVAIGIYYVVTLTPYLLPFIGLSVFFAFAYPLPSRVAAGVFHNNFSFALSWGYLPFLTSYYVNSLAITPEALLIGLPLVLAAWTEIILSRTARKARQQGLPKGAYERPERALKILVLLAYSFAVGLALVRLV